MPYYQSDRNTDEVHVQTEAGGEELTTSEAVEFARGVLEAANFADSDMGDGRTTVIEAIGVDPDDMTDEERNRLSTAVHEHIAQEIGIDKLADRRDIHPDDLFLAVAVEAPD